MTSSLHCSLCGGAGHLAKDCPWLRVDCQKLPGVRGMILVEHTAPHAFNDEHG